MRAGVLVWSLVLLAPLAARAEPAAELREDLDGDGAEDLVRIDQDGAISFELSGVPGGGLWKAFTIPGAELVDASLELGRGAAFGGDPLVVARATFEDGEGEQKGEALALAIRQDKIDEIWRGPVGPQGPDGEWSLHIEASPHGLIRYQRKPRVRRCDDRDPHLFLERYDFAREAFRPASEPAHAPADAPVLRASPEAPNEGLAEAPGLVFRAASTSSQRGAESARSLGPPLALTDGDPGAAWVEGATGFGRGEFVTLSSQLKKEPVVAIRLIPGHGKNPRELARYNRIKEAVLWVGSRAYSLEFSRDPARGGDPRPYYAVLPEPATAACVALVIREVYPGRSAKGRRGHTALGELAVLTELDLEPGGAERALAELASQGGAEARRAAALLERGGESAARAAAQALANAEGEGRHRLLEVLAGIGDPAGAEALAQGLALSGAHGARTTRYAEALASMGDEGVGPLARTAGREDAPKSARLAAAAALGEVAGDAAQSALIGLASSSGEVGRSIALALGARPSHELPALLAAASEAEGDAQPTLWRALGELAASAPEGEHRNAAAEAIAGELASAESYELRYRLAGAAASIDEKAPLDAVESLFEAPPEEGRAAAQAAAIRRVTATALAGNAAERADRILARAARDPDAGVRRRAISALGRRDSDASAPALMAAVVKDPWPRMRRRAAGALGRACAESDRAAGALRRALQRDPETSVRRAALSSLARCRPGEVEKELLAIAREASEEAALRTHALNLLANTEDRAHSSALVEILASERSRAWSDKGAIEVAAAAAAGLGELGSPEATSALADAAGDAAFPAIQAAAVTALGHLCPRGAAQLFENLVESGERRVAVAARAALTSCR